MVRHISKNTMRVLENALTTEILQLAHPSFHIEKEREKLLRQTTLFKNDHDERIARLNKDIKDIKATIETIKKDRETIRQVLKDNAE